MHVGYPAADRHSQLPKIVLESGVEVAVSGIIRGEGQIDFRTIPLKVAATRVQDAFGHRRNERCPVATRSEIRAV